MGGILLLENLDSVLAAVGKIMEQKEYCCSPCCIRLRRSITIGSHRCVCVTSQSIINSEVVLVVVPHPQFIRAGIRPESDSRR